MDTHLLESQRYEILINKVRKCLAFCGADTIVENFKPNILTFWVILVIAIYFVMAIYTMSVTTLEEWKLILEFLVVTLCVTQALSKLYTILACGKTMFITKEWIGQILRENEKSEPILKNAANRGMQLLEKSFNTVMVIYSFTFFILEAMPLAVYLKTGNNVQVIKYKILTNSPGKNFYISYCMQVVQITSYSAGIFAVDFLFIIQIAQMILLVDTFKAKLSLVNAELQNSTGNPTRRLELILRTLRYHQQICRYIKSTEDSFFVLITGQVITCTVSVSIILFTIFNSQYPPGYPMAVFFYTALLAYCALGTMFEYQQERITGLIYGFDWYLLSLKEKKLVLFMLVKSQRIVSLNVSGVTSLNVNTAVKVTKAIYSYMMMLMNFVD